MGVLSSYGPPLASSGIKNQKPENQKPDFAPVPKSFFEKIQNFDQKFQKNAPKIFWSIFSKICLVHFRLGSRSLENKAFCGSPGTRTRIRTHLKIEILIFYHRISAKVDLLPGWKSGFWFSGFCFLDQKRLEQDRSYSKHPRTPL